MPNFSPPRSRPEAAPPADGAAGAPLLTPEETGRFLKLSPQTLRVWRHLRQGPPFVKLGRAVRYRAEDLRAWVEGNIVSTSSP